MIAYSGLFAAALVALILAVVCVFFLGQRGPWGSLWTFFLVLFLALSMVSIYAAPIGPVYWGVAWIPITVAGIIMTILLISAMPHPRQNARTNENINTGPIEKSDLPSTPVGRLFWVLIILLVIAIIIGLANPQTAL